MHRLNLTAITGAGSGVLLGLLLAFQAGAQGQSGGARPSGATGGAVNPAALGNRRPRVPEVQAPSRLPQNKASAEKGIDASANEAANASEAAAESAAAAGCAKANAAIAAAGTGGATGKGQGGAAGAEGRAKAADVVCSGANTEAPADAGQSRETGLTQATLHTDEHAEDGLAKAQSNQKPDDTSGERKKPEQSPPQQ